MIIEPIGIIHTPYKTKEECPIQPPYSSESSGSVEVFADYEQGLKDIETFSHIYLLFYFDRSGEVALVRPTFFDGAVSADGKVSGTYFHGIFDEPSVKQWFLSLVLTRRTVRKKMKKDRRRATSFLQHIFQSTLILIRFMT